MTVAAKNLFGECQSLTDISGFRGDCHASSQPQTSQETSQGWTVCCTAIFLVFSFVCCFIFWFNGTCSVALCVCIIRVYLHLWMYVYLCVCGGFMPSKSYYERLPEQSREITRTVKRLQQHMGTGTWPRKHSWKKLSLRCRSNRLTFQTG